MKSYTELPLTIADLEATPDDGNRYELIEGDLHVSTAPAYLHQSILMVIAFAMLEYLRQNPIGQVVPGVGVIFDEFNGVVPDLVFLTNERLKSILVGGLLVDAPEIAVEILSPGSSNERRDRHVKRKLYSSRGVHEYWIVDPETRTVEMYRKRKQGGFALAVKLNPDDELTSTVLPGFKLSVQVIFAEA